MGLSPFALGLVPLDTQDHWRRRGLDVAATIADLTQRIADVMAPWQLERPAPPCVGGLTSVLVPVQRHDRRRILKATPHAFAALSRDEGCALSLWAGRGAITRLGGTQDGRLQLLEYLEPPGTVDDAQVATLLPVLHGRPAGTSGLPPLAVRMEEMFAWAAQCAGADRQLLARRRSDAQDLCASSSRQDLIHGDLQPKNLMRRAGVPVVIDPIPAVGDGAMDIALWCLTSPPYDQVPERAQVIARDTGHDPTRALAWVRALAAVVAAWPQAGPRSAAISALAES